MDTAQLLEHQGIIIQALEQGKNNDLIYLDFTKVYDQVNHLTL